MATIREGVEIPKPDVEEVNPAVLVLDGDAWIAYFIGDDEETPVLRFRNVRDIRLSVDSRARTDWLTRIGREWQLSFGPTLVKIDADSVFVYWSVIDDVEHAIRDVTYHIREQERAEHSQKNFYDSLTGEVSAERCKAEGCPSNRIPQSVFCRRHHFEAIMKMPCPY